MKKTNYGTIVLMVIGLVMCVGCSQVSFNNPFGESEPARTNVDMADNTADNQDTSSDNQTDKSKPIEYKIHYLNAKNANNPNKMSFLQTDTIVLKDVSADGFTFDGWYEVTDNIADTSTDGWNAGSKTADVTLWAKWTAINNDPTDPIEPSAPTAKIYTIRFDKNTGSGIMADITADVGATITLPTCTFNAPTGKKFGSWNGKADGTTGINYADSANVKNLSEEEGAVVTLYAQWIDKEAHRIIYQNIKNADNSSNPTYFMESESVALADVTTDGYTFDGWYDSSSDFGDAHHVSSWAAGEQTSDVILYAKWTANEVTYTVKRYFQNVSGSGYDTSADIVKSGLTDAMTDVTADVVTGFTAQHIAQQIIAGDGSTVVSVYYDRNVVVYTFNANGGSWDDGSNVKKLVGLYGAEVGTPANPSRVGYTYAGWDKSLPTVFGETAETWTAQWTANTYTIVFDANGGEGTMSNQDMTYDVKTNLRSNTFTRSGYMFLGWATSASSINATYTDIESVSNLTDKDGKSVSLYAKWLERPSEIAVGDIMYSDMTFSSEHVGGKTPIGIVFQVGTKVKIVHLIQGSKVWCLSSADGNKCNPATSQGDGSGNWQIICDAVSDEDVVDNYPAFEYVNGLGGGWYLPAMGELGAVFANKTTIDAAITVLRGYYGVDRFETGLYWSSSSISNGTALALSFSGNGAYSVSKTNHCFFRAVRAF